MKNSKNKEFNVKIKEEPVEEAEVKNIIEIEPEKINGRFSIKEEPLIQEIRAKNDEIYFRKFPDLKECYVVLQDFMKWKYRGIIIEKVVKKNPHEFTENLPIKKEPEEHTKSLTDSSRFQCEICDTKYEHPADFKAHMDTHLKLKCNLCKNSRRSYTKRNLASHVRDVHGNNDLKCQHCLKTFKSPNYLQHHKNYYKHVLGGCRMKANRNNPKYPDGPTCKICGKTFKLKIYLTKHKKLKHPIKRKFKCGLCIFSTPYAGQLARHKATHENFKRKLESRKDWLRCKNCPQLLFINQKKLAAHKKRYHSMKNSK